MHPLPIAASRELHSEAAFHRLLAGMVVAFTLCDWMDGSQPGLRQLALRGAFTLAMLAAAQLGPELEELGGRGARLAVALASILGLGALVWVQGRTNGMHATLLIAIVAAPWVQSSRRLPTAACALSAAALHATLLVGSGATPGVQLQWVVIECLAVLLAMHAARPVEAAAGFQGELFHLREQLAASERMRAAAELNVLMTARPTPNGAERPAAA